MEKRDYSYVALVRALGIEDSFLDRHGAIIAERFAVALLVIWRALKADSNTLAFRAGHLFGINQCLHLASSIIMLGSGRGMFSETLELVAPLARKGKTDVQTLLMAATLAYVMDAAEKQGWRAGKCVSRRLARARPAGLPPDSTVVGELRRRFRDANWMIGPAAMRSLGLNPQKGG